MTQELLSLRRRSDFRATRSAPAVRCCGLRISTRHRPGEPCRLGISVPKRTGNAVIRNLMRRRIREAIRTRPGGPPPGDVLVSVEADAVGASYGELKACLERAFEGLN